MLVFNSFFRHHINDYGKAVNNFVTQKFDETVIFADINQFVNDLNKSLINIHKSFPRCKHIMASYSQNPINKSHYCISLSNGTNNCLTIEATVVNTAFYYDPRKDSLVLTDKGIAVLKEEN